MNNSAVWAIVGMAIVVWTGCSSDTDSSPAGAGAGGSDTGGSAGAGAGGSDTGGSAGAAGQEVYDPAATIETAFAHAKQEAEKSWADPWLAFVEAVGRPPEGEPDYATYHWSYTFAASESDGGGGTVKGIELAYPGWTAKTINEMPMGAYLEEADFSNTVGASFLEQLDKAEQAGLSPDSCVDPSTQSPTGYIVTLRGSTNPTAPGWFWEFLCPGDMEVHRFDAGTGDEIVD